MPEVAIAPQNMVDKQTSPKGAAQQEKIYRKTGLSSERNVKNGEQRGAVRVTPEEQKYEKIYKRTGLLTERARKKADERRVQRISTYKLAILDAQQKLGSLRNAFVLGKTQVALAALGVTTLGAACMPKDAMPHLPAPSAPAIVIPGVMPSLGERGITISAPANKTDVSAQQQLTDAKWDASRLNITKTAIQNAHNVTEPSKDVPSNEIGSSIATAQATSNETHFYRPGTNEPVKISHSDRLQVKGFGSGYRLLVEDTVTRQTAEVPIEQINIENADVLMSQEHVKNPFLGIRVNSVEGVDAAVQLGATKVRINGEGYNLSQPSKDTGHAVDNLKQTIQKAKASNLEMLYVYHPTHLISQTEIENEIKSIYDQVGDYSKFTLEIGNEYNSPNFWQDGNLDTFAQFLKLTTDSVWKMHPNAKIALGALDDTWQLEKLLVKLKKNNVQLGKFDSVALHAYGGEKAMDDVVKEAQRALKAQGVSLPLIVSEYNSSDETVDGNALTKMTDRAQQLGVKTAFVHEADGGEGLSLFLNQNHENPTTAALLMKKWALDHTPRPVASASTAPQT